MYYSPQFPFHHEALARDAGQPPVEALEAAREILNQPEVIQLADDGLLTLGMVRPDMDSAILLPTESDKEAAEEVEKRISRLRIMAKFSIVLDDIAVRDFYAGDPEQSMSKGPSEDPRYSNRWEEFVGFMSGGHSTVLLLHGDNAVPTFREQLGHWNIEKRRDLTTIRGQLAKNNRNNLLHGSDSPTSVVREAGIIYDSLSRQIARVSSQSS